MERTRVVFTAEPARVEVDLAAGARLASWQVAGRELLVTAAASSIEWGCYAMAPWAGRVRDGRFEFRGASHRLPRNLGAHAIHGTVFDRPATIAGPGRFVTELGPPWPWTGRVRQELRLEPDALHLRLEVAAAADEFPASCGWHPWFRRRLDGGAPLALDVRPGYMVQRDAAGIPTGRRVPPPPGPWDDCFGDVAEPVVLTWAGALRLELTSTCDHLVVFDQRPHAVCVEPQTAPPNALGDDAFVVTPRRPLVATSTWRWRAA